jgi:hypothetical protein
VVCGSYPSLFYLHPVGRPLVGEDAREGAKKDPKGIVRELKKDFAPTQAIRRRNNCEVDPVKLVGALFRTIREDLRDRVFDGETVSDCCLTIPIMFDSAQREWLRKAGQIAGFKNVNEVEEPVAVACHWNLQTSANPAFVVVCDIGGGATIITLLKRSKDTWRQHPDMPIQVLEGTGDFASETWKQMVSGNSVAGAAEEFVRSLVSELGRFAAAMKQLNVADAPLLLTGGGCRIAGLSSAIHQGRWSGTVCLWPESEYAAVLGAVPLQDQWSEEQKKRYGRAATGQIGRRS